MPYHIERDHADCEEDHPYAVVRDSDDHVEGCHMTRREAEDHMAALYASEEDGEESIAADGTTVVIVGEQSEASAETDAAPRAFETDLAPEGIPTDDGRFMALGSLSWREPPLTLLVLDENTEMGHLGAVACGHIDEIGKRGLSATQSLVYGSGEMDSGELGQETARRVEEGTLGGVSVDLAIREWGARDPETGEIIEQPDMEEDDWMRLFMGGLQFCVLDGVIGAATIVPFPSFADARIAMLASGELVRVEADLLASAAPSPLISLDGELHLFLTRPLQLRQPGDFTACAAGPLKAPAEWFAKPRLERPTLLTVTAEGRVYGHVSTKDCHNGYADRCLRASPVGEGLHFHTGQVETDKGNLVRVGRVTVKPHAPRGASMASVAAHYDDASRVAAFVRAYDDEHGICVAGVTRSDASPELLRDFLANPPSIDQRRGELLGISSVPVPGLPVVVPEARIVASADGGSEVEMLLLPPLTAELLADAAGEFGAIRYRKTAVVDDAWDASAEEAKIPDDATEAQLRAMYAWVDPDGDPTKKSSYRFIHHHWRDGVGPANRRACSNGIGVLHGGRRGTKIPQADRSGVESHLQHHVDDYNRSRDEEALEQAERIAAEAGLRALAESFS